MKRKNISRFIFVIIIIALAIILFQKVPCYEHASDDGFSMKRRYEVIIDRIKNNNQNDTVSVEIIE